MSRLLKSWLVYCALPAVATALLVNLLYTVIFGASVGAGFIIGVVTALPWIAYWASREDTYL